MIVIDWTEGLDMHSMFNDGIRKFLVKAPLVDPHSFHAGSKHAK